MNRAVILDRDNTLIVNDGDLGDPKLVKLIQGAASAVASLRGLGYKIVIATNQGGVARGKYTEQDVASVNDRTIELLKQHANGALVDKVYFCPFHPEGTVQRYKREHHWRKPQCGMWLKAAEDLKLDLSTSWTVGDKLRDIAAGKAAGTRTILIDIGTEPQPSSDRERPDFVVHNLVEAARVIAQQRRPEPIIVSHNDDQPASADAVSHAGVGPTYPATQALETSHRPAPPRSAGRPFKPWDIQPMSDDDAEAGQPQRSVARATQPIEQLLEQPVIVKTVKVEPAPIIPPPQPPPVQIEESQVEHVEQVQPVDPLEESIDDDETSQPPSPQELLVQILRLLKRGQLERDGDSHYKMVALGLVQPLVLASIVIGITGAGGAGALFNWLTGAVLLQLVVITLLILHWQK